MPTNELVTALANSPPYIAVIFIVIMFLYNQRQQQKFFADQQRYMEQAAERRDKILSEALNEQREAQDAAEKALRDQVAENRERTARIEEDHNHALELLAGNIQNANRLTAALEERTAFILTSGQADSEMLGNIKMETADIRLTVSKILDKVVVIFPSDDSMDARFERLKQEMITAIDEYCEKRKHDSKPIPLIDTPPAASTPDAGEGESAA